MLKGDLKGFVFRSSFVKMIFLNMKSKYCKRLFVTNLIFYNISKVN